MHCSLGPDPPTQDNNLCESLTRLLDCFLEPYCEKEGRDAPKKEVVSKAVAQLEARFIFSLVWSVGCTGPNESRARFDLWLRLQLAQFGMKDEFPDEGLVYDYVRSRRLDAPRMAWSPRSHESPRALTETRRAGL